MIQKNYIDKLSKIIRKYFPKNKHKVFIFGSAIKCNNFRDIDVGFLDDIDSQKLENLRLELEESTFPFFVDLVDFNQVGKDFFDSVVLHQEKKWI